MIIETTYPATVSDFRLDKYEVTVGRFRKFVDAVVGGWRPTAGAGKHAHLNAGQGLSNSNAEGGYEPGWDPAWNTDDTTYRMHAAKSDWNSSLSCSEAYQTWTTTAEANESRPINCVNWYQAAAFCAWDGGFLPSEAEWNYAAAGGSEQRYYPWSNPANSAVIDCDAAAYSACDGDTLNSGTLSPEGDGRYGQSDLAGNVFEWALDWYVTPYHVTCSDCANTTPATLRVLRSASFTEDVTRLTSSHRHSLTPYYRNAGIGLRCARTP